MPEKGSAYSIMSVEFRKNSDGKTIIMLWPRTKAGSRRLYSVAKPIREVPEDDSVLNTITIQRRAVITICGGPNTEEANWLSINLAR